MKEPSPDFVELVEHLKAMRGFDFGAYKDASLGRRIQKRMQTVGVQTFSEYADYLEVHPTEFSELFNTILINVTAFFRDAPAWDHIREVVVPRILASRPTGNIRIWSAGCASGEEAYTLAMVFAEALGEDTFRDRVKIYATDVDEDALAAARQASYTRNDLEDVPPELLERYFEDTGSRFLFRHDLRRSVIFGRHDLIQDAPISRVDLLVCRNTLMYFNAEAQSRILARFHFALNDAGFLFMGKAEMLLTHTATFAAEDSAWRVFQKVPAPHVRERMLLLAATPVTPMVTPERRANLRTAAFDYGPVPQLIIDRSGYLILANAPARQLHGLDAGDIGRLHQDLQLSYRPVDLRTPIERALADGQEIVLYAVQWPTPDPRWFDVHVIPLVDAGAVLGVAVTLVDVTTVQRLEADLQRSGKELESAHQQLQSANEELETTNEELQSTVEELETTNEELQSTNEELETMNEELQSTNDELREVNEALQASTAECNESAAFLQSVMSAVQLGMVVLDRELVVRVWNPGAEDLWGLRAHEAVGTKFVELDIGLPAAALKPALDACNGEGTTPRRDVVLDATNRRGRPIRVRVIVGPLVDASGGHVGVSVLMFDEDFRGTDR
jgi:two-component system CheB/CheR fusion protein